jgi:hypothetical protein
MTLEHSETSMKSLVLLVAVAWACIQTQGANGRNGTVRSVKEIENKSKKHSMGSREYPGDEMPNSEEVGGDSHQPAYDIGYSTDAMHIMQESVAPSRRVNAQGELLASNKPPAATTTPTPAASLPSTTILPLISHDDGNNQSNPKMLNMTVCSDHCNGSDCKSYVTPVGICYSPRDLFGPTDSTWGEGDVLDVLLTTPQSLKTMKEYHTDQESPTEFRRTFFTSTDGSCNNQIDKMNEEDGDTSKANGDSFILPFDACVGPFGPPRPWGWFELVSSIHSYHIDNKI